MTRLRIVLIGIAIVIAGNPLIMLLHTAFEQSLGVRFHAPLTEYLLHGYLPCVLAGIFIARSPSRQRIALCAIVGIVAFVLREIVTYPSLASVIRKDASVFLVLWSELNGMALYVLLIAGSCTLSYHLAGRTRIAEPSNQAL